MDNTLEESLNELYEFRLELTNKLIDTIKKDLDLETDEELSAELKTATYVLRYFIKLSLIVIINQNVKFGFR